ncbi:Glucose-6-P dehydrogenase subunit-like protein [Xylanimonas cellulosilytica DSM 15894]|uniref:Glucose-6-P dehydrogenase subunit-like protein n=1 Tax=Xylanimonas cellulosilytica (strain DSM 15894 / JCM 12276 / CECT 5975 / KCTC 9989 / LMG 20990 / NBRC 107835 / XIL07) TaxID=446471 RepID=D1BS92_XYLCX|nr:glucose-6-phosphate dehydrogenase assembly protein OpcA [Xylanimonas cellulosilytica]ACZ30584.1 Glucose-6-P dehydrogenase subunit-like protein [Xylanimonas cellulosilytica DSM 15894]
MIIDMPETTTTAVDKRLVRLRDEGGAVALGRVLTLVVIADEADVEIAVEAANDASREHPCRVLVLASAGPVDAAPRLDAQIRVGGDAGASEVVILRATGPLQDQPDAVVMPLLLPDAPIVVWWPREAPQAPSAHPIGRMAQRRITDSVMSGEPEAMIRSLGAHYADGDTDLAWARVTLWRGLLAAAVERPPFEPVTGVVIEGEKGHTSLDLLAGWLRARLRCPTTIAHQPGTTAITRVVLQRKSGDILLDRPDGRFVTISQAGAPDRRIALPIRKLSEALIEELRRLDPDEVYEEALVNGLPAVDAESAEAAA